MMNLILAPNPILAQIAEAWDFAVDHNADEIEQQMIFLMKTSDGIGLSGNQVGLLKRVFVIKLKNHVGITEPFAMFNPKVVSQTTEMQTSNEGCLSFPKLWLKVPRPHKVHAEYLDKHANTCTITLEGIDARCFLHELDHLDGMVFTAKVSRMKLILARNKQRKYNGRTQ